MSLLKSERGQFNMIINSLVGLIILALLLTFSLPLLNSLTSSIIASNMSSFSMTSTIIMVVQMFGLLAVALGAMAWVTSVFNPPQNQPPQM